MRGQSRAAQLFPGELAHFAFLRSWRLVGCRCAGAGFGSAVVLAEFVAVHAEGHHVAEVEGSTRQIDCTTGQNLSREEEAIADFEAIRTLEESSTTAKSRDRLTPGAAVRYVAEIPS